MWITKTSINQPVFATMVMVALLVLGIFSYVRLPVEQMPNVSNPVVFVQVTYPGASPEQVENDLIKPIENVLNTVNGVKQIYATTREGSGFMQAEFRLSTDMATATQEVRDKIAQLKPGFPREAKDPLVSRADWQETQPVVNLAVVSEKHSPRELSTLTDQVIVKALQSAPGVGNVSVNGSVIRQVQIYLKPAQMQAYGVGVDQVISAIQESNQDFPSGTISRGVTEQLVRVEGKIKDPKGFEKIIVTRQGKAPVYLSQVADVVDGEQEETSIARINGKRSISIGVFKVQDANIVETGEGVVKAIETLKKRLPEGVEIRKIYSNADDIKSSLDNVKETILEGAILTVVIVFLFLHSWRSTVITGLTLPIAVISTFIALYLFHFTLNFLTLMALSLCIGLLIDDAIVVRENIVRHLGMGKDHFKAAREGTEEIGLAVMATTFAIIAVFVPIAFMSGIIGRYFLQFGITVAVAVLVSLFVSFTLDPMLSSIWHDPAGDRFKRVPWLGRFMDRIEHLVESAHSIYGRLLEWSLAHRRKVLAIAFVTFIGSFFIVPLIGTEFVPENDQGFISLRLNTPIGSSLEYTDAKTRQVEDALKSFPEIVIVDANIGTDDGKNYSRLNLKLSERKQTHRRSQKDLEQAIRAKLATIAGIELSVGWNKPIFISILGPDAEKLTEISQSVMKQVAKIKGITDLESSERGANPTVSVRINNELASDLGLSTARIGRALRPLISGDTISHWQAADGQNYDVIVQLPKAGRRVAGDLGDLYMTSSRSNADGTPQMVVLRQVADFVPTFTAQQVKRLDLQRRISLYAGVEGRPSGDAGSEVQELLKKLEPGLPPGYRFNVGGQQQEMNESFIAMLAALAMAVIFIYLILASQFASFLQPLAIMASLPLALIGVFLALLLTGTTLNLFSMIGFIMLMGLVTKNAILLVDFTNQGLREGKTRHQAILDAGQVRLRPILMTTLAMVFGMLPMSLGLGDGGETQAPMGRAIIGGVITSTLLTLVVVPVLYTYLDSLGAWFKNRLTRKPAAAVGAGAETVLASKRLD
ncbi:MAG: efflux RND transporter permease subunit [Betaproteobacteria bacterium]|nr:efflux RND transporter permease subunit [Betaproteobacteria bacterium]